MDAYGFRTTARGFPKASCRRSSGRFTTKAGGQGTGLGLSIVQEILAARRATIRVESSVVEGTTFILDFPSITDSRRSSNRVETRLVADDDPSTCEFFRSSSPTSPRKSRPGRTRTPRSSSPPSNGSTSS